MAQENTAFATNYEVAAFKANLFSFPDFRIRVSEYEWWVHSNVVARQSKFFEKACRGHFKESDEHIIELHDDCPWMVAHMIYWFYLDRNENWILNEGPHNDDISVNMTMQGAGFPDFEDTRATYQSCSDWQRHAQLYLLADKYEISDLIVMTRDRIRSCLAEDDSPLLKGVVEYFGATIVKNDQDLLKILLEAAYRQMKDSKSLYEEAEAAFTADDMIVEVVKSFLFAKADFKREKLTELSTMIEITHTLIEQNLNGESQIYTNCPYRCRAPPDILKEIGELIAQLQLDIESL